METRYKCKYTGEDPTRVATEPTGQKVDVKKGDEVVVHAAVAAQLRGYHFWEVGEAVSVKPETSKANAEAAKAKQQRLDEQAALENQPGAAASRPLQSSESERDVVDEKKAKEVAKATEANEEAKPAAIAKPNGGKNGKAKSKK